MKGFLFYGVVDCPKDMLHASACQGTPNFEKEAQMKKRIRTNYIFWKKGPLLPRLQTFK
jgi:hypothetical protein